MRRRLGAKFRAGDGNDPSTIGKRIRSATGAFAREKERGFGVGPTTVDRDGAGKPVSENRCGYLEIARGIDVELGRPTIPD